MVDKIRDMQIVDLEQAKFLYDEDGNVIVRTSAKGSFTPSGLTNGGLITEVEINSTTWTALPASPLSARNALAIQNRSGENIKINYADDVVGYVGIEISNSGERFYNITDEIVVYAKSSSSTVTITVEELS